MNLTRRDFIKRSLVLGGSLFFCDIPLHAANPKDNRRYPGYVELEEQGELARRVEQAYAIFNECELCPRQCGANRLNNEEGFCQAGAKLKVHSANPHFGEEISLVGEKGSGTIFFSSCNLRCVFCQNWPIAHMSYGRKIQDAELADLMLHLQKIGCHNINLVTPTHVMPNILNATRLACQKGLRIPLVYNTSGYERFEILKLLDGVVDIYLPDMKFMDADPAEKYMGEASDYPEVSQQAVLEMHRQVGLHRTNRKGIAARGLMIRHLVMPNRVAGTEKFIRWVANNLPTSTYVNLMHQYHPDFKAFDYPQIWRRINVQEYLEAFQWAEECGLTNFDPSSIFIKKIYQKQK